MTTTETVTVTAVLTYVGQPLQSGELQVALTQYRKKKVKAREWMRANRNKPKDARG